MEIKSLKRTSIAGTVNGATFLKSQEGNNVRVEIWKDGIVKGKVTSTSELVQDMIKVDCSLIG